MALELKMDSDKIKKEGRYYLIFALIFIVIAYFFYTTGEKFYTGISKSAKEIESIKSDNDILESKILSLRSIKDSVNADVNALNVSFQSEDPSLFMYSQLKAIAAETGIELSEIAFSQGQPSGSINVGVIGFTVKGIKDSVFNFISELTQSAPLSGLGAMSFSNYFQSGETMEIDMSVQVYYSPLPEVLPDTNEIVNSLTQEEKDAYEQLVKLKVFSVAEIKAQPQGDGDLDPFNFQTVIPEEVQ